MRMCPPAQPAPGAENVLVTEPEGMCLWRFVSRRIPRRTTLTESPGIAWPNSTHPLTSCFRQGIATVMPRRPVLTKPRYAHFLSRMATRRAKPPIRSKSAVATFVSDCKASASLAARPDPFVQFLYIWALKATDAASASLQRLAICDRLQDLTAAFCRAYSLSQLPVPLPRQVAGSVPPRDRSACVHVSCSQRELSGHREVYAPAGVPGDRLADVGRHATKCCCWTR